MKKNIFMIYIKIVYTFSINQTNNKILVLFLFFFILFVVVVVVIFVISEFAGCRLMNKKWYHATYWDGVEFFMMNLPHRIGCIILSVVQTHSNSLSSKHLYNNGFYCSRKCSPNTSTQDWFTETYKLCPASMGKRTSNRWK